MYKRIFLLVLDSFGIGEMPDAKDYGDEGSNTFKSISKSKFFNVNTMKKMGLFNIEGIDFGEKEEKPIACYGRAQEESKGKDTTTRTLGTCRDNFDKTVSNISKWISARNYG